MIENEARQQVASLMTQHLHQHWAEMTDTDRSLSMVMVDVDHFRHISKQYGEQAAEDCLKSLDSIIRRQLRRDSDMSLRCGHDAYCVVLPNTPRQTALNVAERLRKSLGGLQVSEGAVVAACDVTVSCGVASVNTFEALASKAMISLADSALHLAKVAGRNRTVSMSSENLIYI